MNPMNKDVQLKRAATRLALREADKTAKTRSPLPARHNPMTAKGAQKKKKRSQTRGQEASRDAVPSTGVMHPKKKKKSGGHKKVEGSNKKIKKKMKKKAGDNSGM